MNLFILKNLLKPVQRLEVIMIPIHRLKDMISDFIEMFLVMNMVLLILKN